MFGSLVWGGLAALLLNWLLFLSGAGYYRNGQKLQKHYRNFLSLGGLLAGALGGRLFGLEKHYRNISCFARNLGSGLGRLSGALKERKSLNLFLLRSKSGPLFGSLVWGAERTEIAESFLASLETLGFV